MERPAYKLTVKKKKKTVEMRKKIVLLSLKTLIDI